MESKETIEKAVEKSINMAEASKVVGIPYTTFIYQAKKYGVYNPQPQKKKRYEDFTSRSYILVYLFKEGLKEKKCEECELKDLWNGKPLYLTLHHIDGDNTNNNIKNLRVLCPNCHSQTDNYSGKSSRKNKTPPVV